MKRVIVVLIIFSILLASGCSAFYLLKPQVDLLLQNAEVERIEESSSVSKPNQLQNQKLAEITAVFGIEILMNHYWMESNNFVYSDVDVEQYGEIIDTVYEALSLINSSDVSINYIDTHINKLSFCDSIMINNKECDFYPHSYSEGYYNINFATASDSQELAARLLSLVAYNLTDVELLSEFYFNDYQRNGFIDYNDQLDSGELSYAAYLAQYGIIEPENVLIEYRKAGFLTVESAESIRADFAEYIYESISPHHSLWWAYSYVDPIQTKTEIALIYMSAVNIDWSVDYIEYTFRPEHVGQVFNPFSEVNDTYFITDSTYEGTYQNNSGTMHAILHIEDAQDWTGEITARFSFGPAFGNETGKSGEYLLVGDVDFDTNALTLKGVKWISAQPEGYEMLDINGLLFATQLNGAFARNERTEITLYRAEEELRAFPY